MEDYCVVDGPEFYPVATAPLFNSFIVHRPPLPRAHCAGQADCLFLPDIAMHPMLNTAVKAARRGATVINRASFDLDRVTVTEKNTTTSLPTSTRPPSRPSWKCCKKPIRTMDPHRRRRRDRPTVNDESEYVWIIDPLDGTTNFMHGFPQYASRSRCSSAAW
jgi:hypothetical protein